MKAEAEFVVGRHVAGRKTEGAVTEGAVTEDAVTEDAVEVEKHGKQSVINLERLPAYTIPLTGTPSPPPTFALALTAVRAVNPARRSC